MQHAARACRGVGRLVAQSPLGGAVDLATRGLATATPADEVVDQMIAYARDHYRVSGVGGPLLSVESRASGQIVRGDAPSHSRGPTSRTTQIRWTTS